MTIKEKVEKRLEGIAKTRLSKKITDILSEYGVYVHQAEAILALIRPMSRERLYQIFAQTKGCKESLEDCSYKKCKASRTECELLANAILAEWEKKRNVAR